MRQHCNQVDEIEILLIFFLGKDTDTGSIQKKDKKCSI